MKKEAKQKRKAELEESRRDKTEREERSRSTRRPESSQQQRSQAIETSEVDDPPKDGPQLAIQDKAAAARPRFDPSREHAIAKRIAENRRAAIQPQREHQRDPSTEGPPDIEEERRMRRKVPPPPPAMSTRQASARHRPLAFARPPLRRDSATESPFVPSEREH